MPGSRNVPAPGLSVRLTFPAAIKTGMRGATWPPTYLRSQSRVDHAHCKAKHVVASSRGIAHWMGWGRAGERMKMPACQVGPERIPVALWGCSADLQHVHKELLSRLQVPSMMETVECHPLPGEHPTCASSTRANPKSQHCAHLAGWWVAVLDQSLLGKVWRH